MESIHSRNVKVCWEEVNRDHRGKLVDPPISSEFPILPYLHQASEASRSPSHHLHVSPCVIRLSVGDHRVEARQRTDLEAPLES